MDIFLMILCVICTVIVNPTGFVSEPSLFVKEKEEKKGDAK